MSLFKCPECCEVFNFKQTMMIHSEKRHKDQNTTTIQEDNFTSNDSPPKQGASLFECSVCKKSFNYRDALRIHMKKWHGDHKSNSMDLNDAAGSSVGQTFQDFSNHDKDLVKRLLGECDPGMHLLLSSCQLSQLFYPHASFLLL